MSLAKEILKFIWQGFETGPPLIKKWKDLKDPRAYELAVKTFARIKDLPHLYSELEKAQGRIQLDPNNAFSNPKEPPRACSQLIAGAIMHYESTKREIFAIPIDEKDSDSLDWFKRGTVLYGIVKRVASEEEHERVANLYVETAGEIYQLYKNYQATQGTTARVSGMQTSPR